MPRASRTLTFPLIVSLLVGGPLTGCGSSDDGAELENASGGNLGVSSGGSGSGGEGTLTTGGGISTGGLTATGGTGSLSTGGSGTTGSGGDGTGGSDAATGGTGEPAGFSSDREQFGLGDNSLCPSGFTVCESFETTEPGQLPSGFSLAGYGNRTVGVSELQQARGQRSLQIDVPEGQGAVVAMLRLNDLGNLGGWHFGRMFYRVAGPGPSQFIHFDVLEAVGPWMGHENGVRFASTGTGVGTSSSHWSWIYNVQPFGNGAGSEFGSEGDRSAHPKVDEWMCLEWEFNAAEQTASYFHDGEAIEYLVIDTERSEIPVFTEISLGFQKFQTTDAVRVWVDEIALHPTRVGCNY